MQTAPSAALQEVCGIFSETNIMFKLNTPSINKKGKQMFKSPQANKLIGFITQCPKNACTRKYWKSTEETYAKQESETEKQVASM